MTRNECPNCGMSKAIEIMVATARDVAARWRGQYYHDGEWKVHHLPNGSSPEDIYNRLCALGLTPGIEAVAEIIGNKSWSYLQCCGCHEHVTRAVALGGDYTTILVCETCIRDSLTAISRGAETSSA